MDFVTLTVGFLVLFSGGTAYVYNRLVVARNFVKDAWAGIEVQLTKRHDLVPALIKIVKAYSSHESTLFEKVARIRTPEPTSDALATEKKEHSFAKDLGKLFALIEDYPKLKADANFRQLHEQLVALEGDIESARRYYNGTARELNILVESFPSNVVATLFKFTQAAFFKRRVASVGDVPLVALQERGG